MSIKIMGFVVTDPDVIVDEQLVRERFSESGFGFTSEVKSVALIETFPHNSPTRGRRRYPHACPPGCRRVRCVIEVPDA